MPHPDQVLGLVDTLPADVAAQIPSDVYSDFILEGLYAARQLAGILAATEEDITAGDGDTVQVPFIDARAAQGPVSAGAALTATKSVTGTYSMVLGKYGDFEQIAREVFKDQSNFREPDFVRAQFLGLAEKVDDLVYTELETATIAASHRKDLATKGVLTDVYDKIVEVRAALLTDKVKPTHVIVHPDVETQLLKDTSQGVKFESIRVANGRLLEVAGLTAVVTPLANANAATVNLVQAVVIDKSRAVGEAWGRRPEFLRDFSQIEKDLVKLVTWIRYGTSDLDVKAIGRVTNAAV